MTWAEVKFLVEQVRFMDYRFVVTEEHGGEVAIHVTYYEPDADRGGAPELQVGRDWPIPHNATASQVIRTAFKACLTSMEHRTREHFRYLGKAIFSPHLDVDKLARFYDVLAEKP